MSARYPGMLHPLHALKLPPGATVTAWYEERDGLPGALAARARVRFPEERMHYAECHGQQLFDASFLDNPTPIAREIMTHVWRRVTWTLSTMVYQWEHAS